MPDKKPPSIPDIPASGEDIYNTIMGGILPELMIPIVYSLEEKYKDESPEERKARGQQYKEAYEKYDKQYAEYVQKKDEEMKKFGRDMGTWVEGVYREDEEKQLKNLESSMSSI